jgi:hypothetical protein
MAVFTKHPEVVCTELEDGAVLLNLETRLYYSLDRVGLDIWNLVDSVDSREDLVDRLMQSYEAGDESPHSIVTAFLDLLKSESLLVASESDVQQPPLTRSQQQAGRTEKAKTPLTSPMLLKHDEPLHEVPLHPFDPQLPLAE